MSASEIEPENPPLAYCQRVARRDLVFLWLYWAAFPGALVFVLTPFPLSRIGGILLLFALTNVMAKLNGLRRRTKQARAVRDGALLVIAHRIESQRSAFYNLPFLVGANLVFMGLPMTENPVTEAWYDCLFLAVSVMLMAACYMFNQAVVRRELLPLFDLVERMQPAPEQAD